MRIKKQIPKHRKPPLKKHRKRYAHWLWLEHIKQRKALEND